MTHLAPDLLLHVCGLPLEGFQALLLDLGGLPAAGMPAILATAIRESARAISAEQRIEEIGKEKEPPAPIVAQRRSIAQAPPASNDGNGDCVEPAVPPNSMGSAAPGSAGNSDSRTSPPAGSRATRGDSDSARALSFVLERGCASIEDVAPILRNPLNAGTYLRRFVVEGRLSRVASGLFLAPGAEAPAEAAPPTNAPRRSGPDGDQGRIVAFVLEHGPCRAGEVATALSIALGTVYSALARSAARGELDRRAHGTYVPPGWRNEAPAPVTPPARTQEARDEGSAGPKPTPPTVREPRPISAPAPLVHPPAPVARPAARPAPAAAPPAAPVRLMVLPVDKLTSGDDRFACVPLKATMASRSCVARQAMANGAAEGVSTAANATRVAANTMTICKNCKLGESVARQLAKVAKKSEATA